MAPGHVAERRVRVKDASGFTLIELVTVAAIIGVLALIAIPIFARFLATARQTEALTNLNAIYAMESAFYGENTRYGSFSEIGFTIAGNTHRYTYRSPALGGGGGSAGTPGVDLLSAGGPPTPENTFVPSDAALATLGSAGSFTATATGNLDNDSTVDMWHVDDLKQGLDGPDSNDVRS